MRNIAKFGLGLLALACFSSRAEAGETPSAKARLKPGATAYADYMDARTPAPAKPSALEYPGGKIFLFSVPAGTPKPASPEVERSRREYEEFLSLGRYSRVRSIGIGGYGSGGGRSYSVTRAGAGNGARRGAPAREIKSSGGRNFATINNIKGGFDRARFGSIENNDSNRLGDAGFGSVDNPESRSLGDGSFGSIDNSARRR